MRRSRISFWPIAATQFAQKTTGSALLWVAKPLQPQTTTKRNALARFARFCGAHRRGRSSSGFNAIDKWCAHKTFIISICLAAIVGGVAVVVFRPPLVSLDAKTILTWHYNLVYKYNLAIFALHSAAAGAWWWWWWFWSSLAVCACMCQMATRVQCVSKDMGHLRIENAPKSSKQIECSLVNNTNIIKIFVWVLLVP